MSKKHFRVQLAENQAGQVIYCDTCRHMQMDIGAISLLVEANAEFTEYQRDKANFMDMLYSTDIEEMH